MPDRARPFLALLALLAGCGMAQARAPQKDEGLARAIVANDVAGVEAALAERADPDQRLAFGATPLSWAVNVQNPAIVAALLTARASVNSADQDGVTPLALACELGEPAIVAQLLDARADVRVARADGTTPLAVCARYGPADAVARMLAMGAAPDRIDSRGQTPLMWAAAAGRTEAIALLLKAGANPNCVSKGGFTPLFFAIKSDVVSATQALLAAGADSAYRGPENTSAAQLALYQKNYAAAALLVPHGVDVVERDRTGEQLLHGAAAGGDINLIRLLLAKGADPNGLTGPSRITWVTEANFGVPPPPVPPTPPLLIAAANGRKDAMALLLAAGADPRFVTADGTNVVLAAARGGSAATLDYALSLAPDVNVAGANFMTALHWLVAGGVQPELEAMLKILAAHGARTDIPSKYGATAAQMADGGLTQVKQIFRTVFPDKTSVKMAGAAPQTVPEH
ncbi:ankyrin repeat domain-containing protein [Sphingobium sp. AS12]|uniref:ankyrin repeat domain-containing protein n=1 Tax=Sphingobium sp. AS12 TaxID=2849495 RepID=UPI001C31C174|nr:ankyrin repeat domain-containing protein [Sphingobium sp. AS12]